MAWALHADELPPLLMHETRASWQGWSSHPVHRLQHWAPRQLSQGGYPVTYCEVQIPLSDTQHDFSTQLSSARYASVAAVGTPLEHAETHAESAQFMMQAPKSMHTVSHA